MVTATAIKKGYKQTELGIIPEDWGVVKLGRMVSGFEHGKGLSKAELREDGTTKCIHYGQLFTEYKELIKKVRSKTFIFPGALRSVSNDVLIPTSDVTPRGLATASCIKETGVILGGGILVVRLTKEYDGVFLSYYISQNKTNVLRLVKGSTVFHLYAGDLSNLLVAVPGSLFEQKTIADALSDTDALIEHLQKLIDKKKVLKQGTMNQLLTGKKRLPGFSAKWEIKSLNELFDFSGGVTASREQLSEAGTCYLHYGDIHGAKKSFVDVSKEYADIPKLQIKLQSVPQKSLLNDGDLVFVDASEDDDGASKHVVIRNTKNIPYISGLHTIVAKGKDNSLDGMYKQYCFQTSEVKAQFKFFSVGTKVTGISKRNIAKIQIPVPALQEQKQIAEILNDMDSVLMDLEQKRDKYVMLKQGMMQQLLTGRIRIYANK